MTDNEKRTYAAVISDPTGRTVSFESAATTDSGIARAAKAAVVEANGEKDNPFFTSGYRIYMTSPIHTVEAEKTEEEAPASDPATA